VSFLFWYRYIFLYLLYVRLLVGKYFIYLFYFYQNCYNCAYYFVIVIYSGDGWYNNRSNKTQHKSKGRTHNCRQVKYVLIFIQFRKKLTIIFVYTLIYVFIQTVGFWWVYHLWNQWHCLSDDMTLTPSIENTLKESYHV